MVFRVYDLAALRFRGLDAEINFSIDDYHEDLKYVGPIMYVEWEINVNDHRLIIREINNLLHAFLSSQWLI